MKPSSELRIGQVAREAGMRTSKIRYYESVGLLGLVQRVGAYRVYGRDTLDRLRFIEFAQHAGFTIDEIRHLLEGFGRQTSPSARWQTMARRKLSDVTRQIARAHQMQNVLNALLTCQCAQLSECVQLCDPASQSVSQSE